MKYIDCYTPLTKDDYDRLKNAGVDGVIRYLGCYSCGFRKGMNELEVGFIKNAGLQLVSIFERSANNMLGGYHAGVQDASDALADAARLGQPIGSAIYFACDLDAVYSQLSEVSAYMGGVRDTLAGKYLDGIYGSYTVLNSIKACKKWASYAWQYGKVFEGANIRQMTNDTTLAGLRVDENEVVTDPGDWWSVKLQAEPKETIYNVVVDGRIFAAIAKDDKTYILWTVLGHLGIPYSHTGNGIMEYSGQTITGVVYNNDTYLPWDTLGVKAERVMWNFSSSKS